MSKHKLIGSAIPNLPWEEKPAGHSAAIWRSARNPIIPRNFIPRADRIYNSAHDSLGRAPVGHGPRARLAEHEDRAGPHVSNVCFPCAALADSSTGRISIYYGAADTVVGLAYTTLGDLMDFMES